MPVLPEDGAASVTALNGPVQIVPMVHPANGRIGNFRFVQRFDRLPESDFPQQRKDAIQDAAIRSAGDHRVTGRSFSHRLDPETVTGYVRLASPFRDLDPGDAAEHSPEASRKFVTCGGQHFGTTKQPYRIAQRLKINFGHVRRQGLIPQPGIMTAFGVQTKRGHARAQ